MDESIEIELFCDCHNRITPFLLTTKDCEWNYKTEARCPPVPLSDQFDWECDIRSENCEVHFKAKFISS